MREFKNFKKVIKNLKKVFKNFKKVQELVQELQETHKESQETTWTDFTTSRNTTKHVGTLAFLRAMQFAKDFGISYFTPEADALCVAQKINSNQADLSMTGHIMPGIQEIVKEFSICANHSCK